MAGKLLRAAVLTESGRPVLYPNEIECTLFSSVDLEPDSDYERDPLIKSSVLILTTHRLIFIQSHPSTSAVFLPLSSITHIFTTKKKSIKQMFSHHPKVKFSIGQPRALNLTLVLRGKGDFDLFLSKFWESWRGRAWEHDQKSESSSSSSGRVDGIGSSSSTTSRSGLMMAGVSGILRKEQETWENTDKTLQDAFQDLDALMNKAKEVVVLAEKMRQKLLSGPSTQANASNDEELGSKQEIQDWMLSVGIVSPVTKESAGALYHQQLSRQLADFVKTPLDRAGGMINLIDVYCLFNRARGTELISPEDLLRACSIWESFDVSVMLRKFDSGVMVIQNKFHSDEEVFAKIKSIVLKSDALQSGISASDAAMTLGIAPAMAKEHLLNAETKGLLCRDISPDGFRFYINLFYEINLADKHLVKDHGIYASWVTAVSASK